MRSKSECCFINLLYFLFFFFIFEEIKYLKYVVLGGYLVGSMLFVGFSGGFVVVFVDSIVNSVVGGMDIVVEDLVNVFLWVILVRI